MAAEADTPPETGQFKISPDRQAMAVRTIFEDDTPGAVSAWLSGNRRGISTYLTESQVADWTDIS